MYYKIRNDVLFRKYQGHGYITDNSEYGYRMLNDARIHPGEKYVSASGAVMLSMLSKSLAPLMILLEICRKSSLVSSMKR